MLTIPRAILRSDLTHLSKDELKDVCIDLDLAIEGTTADLSTRIWERIEKDNKIRDSVLAPHKNKLYAGKTALTWYGLSSGASLKGSVDLVKNYIGYDPFNEMVIPTKDELRAEPALIGGVIVDDNSYYLRFMYKSGMIPVYQGNELVQVPTTGNIVVFVDEKENCIEVRANSKKAKNIISKFAGVINKSKFIEPRNIMAKYGNDIEKISNKISGNFIDSTSKPELLLEDLNHNQADSVFNMLKALDNFFEDDDIDNLKAELNKARDNIGEEANGVPFTALVLAGLHKVGLGVNGSDLRENQLYKYLNEYMQHQGGFIQFSLGDCSYTIRVGSGTNSITFLTPSTEEAIKFVRDNIIIN